MTTEEAAKRGDARDTRLLVEAETPASLALFARLNREATLDALAQMGEGTDD